MAATGSEIRRLAADVAARNQAQERASRSPGAALWGRLAALTIPLLICAVLAITIALALSALRSGEFLGLSGWTAIGVVGIVGAILMNTVWLRSPRLNGFVVTAKSAPDLHSLVRDTAKELQSPLPGSIIVTDSLTVKLHQVPRLGLLGGTSSVLEIGLPAAQTYSASELAVFIAMELARFSSVRNYQDRHVERMADLWTGVMQPSARPSLPMDFIAGAFASWLAPRLADTARPGRAAWTSTADRAVAELIGRQETAQALQRRVIAIAFLDEYWHRLADEPILTPKPSFEPYREMADFLPRIGEWEQAEQALRLALSNRGADAGAEPSLAQRLKAIGARPTMPEAVLDTGTRLLGTSHEKAVQYFDLAWQRANAKAWSRAYAEQKAAGTIPVLDPLSGVSAGAPDPDLIAAALSPRTETHRVSQPIVMSPPADMSVPDATPDFDLGFDPRVDDRFDPAVDDDLVSSTDVDHGATTTQFSYGETEEPASTDTQTSTVPASAVPSVEIAIDMALGAELSEDFEHARDRYVDACEWYPDNGRVWLAYAHALLRHDDEAALDCIEHTLSLAAQTEWAIDDGQTWLDLGKALLEAGDEGGIVCLEQAIAIDDALTDAAMVLADQFDDSEFASDTAAYEQPAQVQSTAIAS
jgi:tetratricopeptide (TPR) repeat protein